MISPAFILSLDRVCPKAPEPSLDPSRSSPSGTDRPSPLRDRDRNMVIHVEGQRHAHCSRPGRRFRSSARFRGCLRRSCPAASASAPDQPRGCHPPPGFELPPLRGLNQAPRRLVRAGSPDPPVLCDRRSPSPRPSARHLETSGQPNGGVGRPSPNETNSQRKQPGSEGGQGQLCSMPVPPGPLIRSRL